MPKLLLLLLIAVSSHLQASQTEIYIHGVESASYTDSSGELRGKHHGGQSAMLVELIRELMIALDQPPHISLLPYADAIDRISTRPASALAGVSRNGVNASAYKWVGPLQDDVVYLFEEKTRPAGVDSIADLDRSARICVRRGNGHAELLQRRGFSQLQPASSYKICLDRLLAGEAELAALNQMLVPTVLESNSTARARIRNSGIRVHQQDVSLAFSADSPDALIQQWQQALERIRNSEAYQGLIHHFYCRQDCF